MSIGFEEIIQIEKKSTIVLFNNAIQIVTLHSKMFFTSFVSRDSAYAKIVTAWRNGLMKIDLTSEQFLRTAKKSNYPDSMSVFDEDSCMAATGSDLSSYKESLRGTEACSSTTEEGGVEEQRAVRSMDEIRIGLQNLDQDACNILKSGRGSCTPSLDEPLALSTPSMVAGDDSSVLSDVPQSSVRCTFLNVKLFLNIRFLKKILFSQDTSFMRNYLAQCCMFENVKIENWRSSINSMSNEWTREITFTYPIYLMGIRIFSTKIVIDQEFLNNPSTYDQCNVLTTVRLGNSYLSNRMCVRIATKMEMLDGLWSKIYVSQLMIEVRSFLVLLKKLLARIIESKMKQEITDLYEYLARYSEVSYQKMTLCPRKRRYASWTNVIFIGTIVLILSILMVRTYGRQERIIKKLILKRNDIIDKYSSLNSMMATNNDKLQQQFEKFNLNPVKIR